MTALAILMIGTGLYMCYAAYEAIHNKTAATPVVKAKAAL